LPVAEDILASQIKQDISALGQTEIIVGIPSYNNASTIGHVVRAAHGGLLKFFPDRKAVIVNSDGGSKDGTMEAVEQANLDTASVLSVSHPLYPVHRLTTPYHGLPGKGSAFRTLFRIAEVAQASALAVVDADLRSISPEWFDLLLRPVLDKGYDYVAPYYKRHKFDGTITNSIVYPLTRALYGRRVRQPIGGEFGISGRLASRLLKRDVWGTDVARYGIDIWMTTTAIAENFKICQSYLGAKIHDPKDPGSDLGSMLVQVVGSVFSLMETYDAVWRNVLGSLPAPLFGLPFEVGLEPVPINLDHLLASYRQAVRDLLPVYQTIVSAPQLSGLEGAAALPDSQFALSDDLWVAVIYDFALGYHRRVIDREHLVKALAPLYLGWVASFARQAQDEKAAQVEERIEKLSLVFEQLKPYLINQWPLRSGMGESKP
jgi:glycosyltransferase involved in cell wall biosynthesis